MESWVYLFSQFTPEALIFEALFICLLISIFAGLWLARRKNAKETMIPGSVLQNVLSDLAQNSQSLHNSLFGGDISVNGPGANSSSTSSTPSVFSGQASEMIAAQAALSPSPSALEGDPATAQKIAELEKKLSTQAKEMEALLIQKQKIESGGSGASSGSSSVDTSELEKKIKELEDKLAEYSVIEDDLANLKRLQQENTQLKAQLGGGAAAGAATGATPAASPSSSKSSVSPASPTETKIEEAPAPEAEAKTEAAAPPADTKTKTEATTAPAAKTAAAPAPAESPAPQSAAEASPAAPASATPNPKSEEVLKSVEQSLNETESAAAASAQPEAAAGATSVDPLAEKPEPAKTPAAETPPADKANAAPADSSTAKTPSSDDELIAEFEKMLSS